MRATFNPLDWSEPFEHHCCWWCFHHRRTTEQEAAAAVARVLPLLDKLIDQVNRGRVGGGWVNVLELEDWREALPIRLSEFLRLAHKGPYRRYRKNTKAGALEWERCRLHMRALRELWRLYGRIKPRVMELLAA